VKTSPVAVGVGIVRDAQVLVHGRLAVRGAPVCRRAEGLRVDAAATATAAAALRGLDGRGHGLREEEQGGRAEDREELLAW